MMISTLKTVSWHPLPIDFSYSDPEHRYFGVGEVRSSVTQILEADGKIDTTWFTDADAWRGKYVHACQHYDATGDLDETTVRPEMRGYLESGRRAIRELGLTIIEAEKRIWNPTWKYGGTLDLLARQRNGKLVIVDYKSGAIADWVRLQLSGYALGCAQPWLLDRMAIRLKPDGKYSCVPYPMNEFGRDKDEFLRAVMRLRTAQVCAV